MKKAAVRVASLIATFIFVAASSATLTIQLAAPQRPQSVIQQCRSNCASDLQICLQRAHGDGPEKESCYRRNRYWPGQV
jgi:hypothetical protein